LITQFSHKICCDKTCKTCDGSADSDCISCNDEHNREFNPTSEKCECKKDHWEAVVPLCTACHVGCNKCADVTGICMECDKANNFEPNN